MSSGGKKIKKLKTYDHENKAAERLAAELDSPLGAQRLGNDAFKMAQEEAAKQGVQL